MNECMCVCTKTNTCFTNKIVAWSHDINAQMSHDYGSMKNQCRVGEITTQGVEHDSNKDSILGGRWVEHNSIKLISPHVHRSMI